MIMQSKLDQDVILFFISLSIKYLGPQVKDTNCCPIYRLKNIFRRVFRKIYKYRLFKKVFFFLFSMGTFWVHFELVFHQNWLYLDVLVTFSDFLSPSLAIIRKLDLFLGILYMRIIRLWVLSWHWLSIFGTFWYCFKTTSEKMIQDGWSVLNASW